MIVDVATFLGTYPFRAVPGTDANALLAQMDRLRIDEAWVGHLAAPWHRDPRLANRELTEAIAPHAPRLLPIPTVHPDLPSAESDVGAAIEVGAPGIRVYPMQQVVDPAGPSMQALLHAAASLHLVVILTTRFEDLRQRHPLDAVPDLPAAAVRALARCDGAAKLLVTHADRGFIEEVHFGLTPEERTRVLWDISWIWGPPEDDLARLLETVGDERFTLGTEMPLRIGDGPFAKLDLLDCSEEQRARLTGGNLRAWRG
jgi:predicted TIM-barrel fold metal-dependent hydrolase